MQYLFFIFSGVAFVVSALLLIGVKRNTPLLFSKTKINKIVKLANFGLPICVFKNGDWTLVSFKNWTFTLNFKTENCLKIQFFEENSPICVKREIGREGCVYGVLGNLHSTELCVKQQNCIVLCSVHNTIKIVIQKNRLPFRVGVNKDSIKFDNFRLDLICDGKFSLNIFEDSLQYEIRQASRIELNYSSLELQTLSNKEIKQIAIENFGLPVLNFEKPDFSQLYKSGLRGDYARDCVQQIKFALTEQPTQNIIKATEQSNQKVINSTEQLTKNIINPTEQPTQRIINLAEQPTANTINLTKLGFSKWTTLRKWGSLLVLEDWLTNYFLKIYTTSQTHYLCCWWGELLLCLDGEDYTLQTLPFELMKEGKINLFNYNFNWQFFPRKMQFDFAYAMLKYMNKHNISKWLEDTDIATFILNCLPKELEMNKTHYNFVRELYPFIVLKPLKEGLLLFMQKYEQMFYKNI